MATAGTLWPSPSSPPTNLGALERNAYLTVSVNPASASVTSLTLAGYLAELSYDPDKLTLVSSGSNLIGGSTYLTAENAEAAIKQGNSVYMIELVTSTDVNVVKLMYVNYGTGVTGLSTDTDFLNITFQVKDDGATGTDLTMLNATISNLCKMVSGTPTDIHAAAIAGAGVAIDGVQEYVLGDANGDTYVNVFDIIRIQNHIFGTSALGGTNFKAADVNGDGNVNVFDIIRIQNYILGQRVTP